MVIAVFSLTTLNVKRTDVHAGLKVLVEGLFRLLASIFCSKSKKLGKDIITKIRLIPCFHSSDHAADVLILYNQRMSETQKL